jgi:glutamyl endopeptidase
MTGGGFPQSGSFDRGAQDPVLGSGRIIGKNALRRELEVIGTDDRLAVTNTVGIPYRFICALDLFFPDPDDSSRLIRFRGSGTLISPRHVLTAGHCLFTFVKGSAGTRKRTKVSAIRVSPGRIGSLNPLGSATMQSFRIGPAWQASRNPRFDYGLITLREAIGDRPQAALGGQPLGFWGSPTRGMGTTFRPPSPAALGGQTVNISGYPGDKPAGTAWRAFGGIVNVSPAAGSELIYHDIDTCGGHSGSPIWIRSGQVRNLVAIHTGSCVLGPDCSIVPGAPCRRGGQRRSSNRGVRISSAVWQDIAEWMRRSNTAKISAPSLRLV